MLQIMQIGASQHTAHCQCSPFLPNNKLQLGLYAGSPKDGAPLVIGQMTDRGMPSKDSALKK